MIVYLSVKGVDYMVFFIDEKKYEYDNEEMSMRLLSTEGTEGNVYQIGDRAVKIYRPFCLKNRLDENTVDYLKTIETKRILLPREKVTDKNGMFCGYTTEYVRPVNRELLTKLKMKKLLEEIKLFEQDTDILTEKNVSIADLTYNNIEYSDGIYFCDPGSFELEDEDNRFNRFINCDLVREFFIKDIICKYSKINKKLQKELMDKFSYDIYLSEMIESTDFDENETMSQYVKKMINKR